MRVIFQDEALAWLSRAISPARADLSIEPMPGATSSSLFLITVPRDGTPRRCVLRVLDNREWLAEEPDLIRHEAAALDEAQRAGLAAPHLIAWSEADVGFGAPALLMSFVEGQIELRPPDFGGWLAGLAGQLATIHRRPADAFPWGFRSWVNRAALAVPSWTAVPEVWERAIAYWFDVGRGGVPSHTVFIHRDYHPTNVLWRGGAVSGVVDWINACRGPAGVDVAHCRTNLAQMYGPDAADQFLDAYLAAAEGFIYDPYWDIDSVLDMCLPQPTFYEPWAHFGLDRIEPEENRRRIDAYLEQVMRRSHA